MARRFCSANETPGLEAVYSPVDEVAIESESEAESKKFKCLIKAGELAGEDERIEQATLHTLTNKAQHRRDSPKKNQITQWRLIKQAINLTKLDTVTIDLIVCLRCISFSLSLSLLH